MQSLIFVFIFIGARFALFGKLQWYEMNYVVFWHLDIPVDHKSDMADLFSIWPGGVMLEDGYL